MSRFNPDFYQRYRPYYPAEVFSGLSDLLLTRGACKPFCIADVGCGMGHSAVSLLREMGEARVVAIDTDPEMLRVGELLILREDVPRSLHACMNDIYEILQKLSDNERREPERLAGEIHAQLHYGKSDQVFEFGLHEYLMKFLAKIEALNAEIDKHYLVPDFS